MDNHWFESSLKMDKPANGAAVEGDEASRDAPLGNRNENPSGIGFWALVREDFQTHESDLLSQGFWAIFAHRFGNWRMGIKPRAVRWPFSFCYRAMHQVVLWGCGISLDYTVVVGRRVRIWHHGGMVLGARSIGDDVHIRHNTTFGLAQRGAHWTQKPAIGDRVDIGTGAVIVGPISVGADAVIGANAVVLHDVPPNHRAVGIPARVAPRGPRDLAGNSSGG